MEDDEIVKLYRQRDEDAVTQTATKYGRFCFRIAQNFLTQYEDAEECVSDTYQALWDRIPPDIPHSFQAYLGRIVRNLAISRFRLNHAQKRYSGMDVLLSELDECIPAPETVEEVMNRKELSEQLNFWLDSLPRNDRVLFVRRYWYGDSVRLLADETGHSSGYMARHMMKLRGQLRNFLIQEGHFL